MTIQTFIEKAIEGGWDFTDNVNFSEEDRSTFKRIKYLKDPKNIAGFWGEVFLDPLAWQAVGKVEGWVDAKTKWNGMAVASGREWLHYMHRMIDALADGKTAEEFIEIL